MTSYSNFQYFSLFSESVRRVSALKPITGHFEELAKLEGIPDLRSVFSRLDKGLQRLPKLRMTRNARKFREWLSTVEHASTDVELARAYVDSISDAKGIFDSRVGKFSKSVLMTAVGAGIGFAIDQSLEGVAGGAAVTKILEPVADLSLDLLDTYLLEGITKGWTPRMFIDDLRKFKKEDVG